MSALVITASESTAGSPFARSIVSTVSMSAPVKRGVRRTSSQATSARLRVRPVRRLRSVADGTQPARRARSGFPAAARASIGIAGIGRGRSTTGTRSARG